MWTCAAGRCSLTLMLVLPLARAPDVCWRRRQVASCNYVVPCIGEGAAVPFKVSYCFGALFCAFAKGLRLGVRVCCDVLAVFNFERCPSEGKSGQKVVHRGYRSTSGLTAQQTREWPSQSTLLGLVLGSPEAC